MARVKAKGRRVASRSSQLTKVKVKTLHRKPDAINPPVPTEPSHPTDSHAKRFEPTDVGDAERLIGRYGDDLRYCAAWGKWLIWDGLRWVTDRTKKILWLAKETVLAMKSEAKVTDDDDQRSKIRRNCRASQSAARLEAMCRVAESDRMVAITPEQLDQDPFLLNCKNGTFRHGSRPIVEQVWTLTGHARGASDSPDPNSFDHRGGWRGISGSRP